MPGSILRSERFVVSIECGTRRHKVFQCQFAKRDGSMFINFPYFQHKDGIVSLVAWPGGEGSTVLSLEPGGRVSSHLVKYSHHASGRAHFSQDGKVRTIIKKDAVPLGELEGHLFTLHVHGFDAFETLTDEELNELPSAKKTGLRFTFSDGVPPSVKFVGMLYRDTSLERRAVDGVVHPSMQFAGPDGKTRTGLICSTALGLPGQERCLLLYCEPLPRLDQTRESSMLFFGGFDSATAMNDANTPVTLLAFSYPAENVEDLRQRLGSIDLSRP
jgi:hypothetical protein